MKPKTLFEVDVYGKETDACLVERGRSGDAGAIDALFVRYRTRAFGWASHLTGDAHMADDIVQEALLRAYLYLDHLIDGSRFAPWLRTIVRNQALMKLRRGGPYCREQPFSSYGTEGGAAGEREDEMDRIWYRAMTDRGQQPGGPDDRLLRRETEDDIRAKLGCLSRRERAVFEAYFFRELRPREIADLYTMSTGNVYNCISRSRSKMRKTKRGSGFSR